MNMHIIQTFELTYTDSQYDRPFLRQQERPWNVRLQGTHWLNNLINYSEVCQHLPFARLLFKYKYQVIPRFVDSSVF